MAPKACSASCRRPGSVRIVKAFHKIKSRKARQLLVEMAEEFADAQAA